MQMPIKPVSSPSQVSLMQAITQDRYGLPEVLSLGHIDRPVPRDHEVLIQVRASSVNAADWILMRGRPYLARLATGLRRPSQPVLGMDAAGRVEAVGPGVTRFRPGDEVYGEVTGAYAEYACGHEDKLALKPASASFEQAAACPIAGVTALQAMRDKAEVQPGDKVLIIGASGGVGTFAVQIARALGAEVTGVCSTRNLDLVCSLGAAHTVDYTREDFTRGAARYDAILDLIGSAPISACRRITRPGGVYISSVGRLGRSLAALSASLVPRFGSGRVTLLAAQANHRDLSALGELVESGEVEPTIDRRYSLAEVPEALRRQGEGHARGKSVIGIQ